MPEVNTINTYSEQVRLMVWQKAQKVEGYDSASYRKDCCGAWMAYSKYGDTTSPYGWEIDHVFPQALGGDDHIENLRAMNWHNNRSKADDYPAYRSAVKADGSRNVQNDDVFTINDELRQLLSKLYD